MTDSTVLSAIGEATEPLSRADVARLTGLSKPGVAAAAKRLAERGVVHEVGVREGRRGGVATLFELNADHGRSLALVIQSTAITLETRDLAGAVTVALEERISASAGPAEIIRIANDLIDRAGSEHPAPLLAAAVSVADPVDVATGKPIALERSVFPAAAATSLADLRLPETVDVMVDNDVNWATLGEHRSGVLRGRDDFLYIYLGAGLGAGLMLDGRLFRGHRGLAGEIGYLLADAGGAGADGAGTGGVAASRDLTERLIELGLGSPGRYEIDLAKAAGVLADPAASAAIADLLARLIANIVIVLNPSAIALGGPLSAYPALTDRLRERVRSLTLSPPEFVLSDSTPLLGASSAAHHAARSSLGITEAQL